MTVENCIKLLEIYKDRIKKQGPEYETGTAGRGRDTDERASIKKTAEKALENMKDHIRNSKKFKGHPILDELDKAQGLEEVETPGAEGNGTESTG